MQTLSDLAKNIQQKTSEQAKNTEQIVSSEFQQLEQNLQQKLSESERSIFNAIVSHEKSLKEQINKTLAYKTAIGGIMGLLLAIILGLGIFSLWLGKNIRNQQAELAEIQQNIDQSPLQAKALAKLELMEEKGVIYIASKKGAKAESYQNKDKQQILKIK
ncbi:MbeB family mobilization protein [Acinetobacter ursingii]|uniref:MbeB family mobilization protein n=1 Tax=Acinetobacter ursingii TaxID=108980 RepID=UPI003AF45822